MNNFYYYSFLGANYLLMEIVNEIIESMELDAVHESIAIKEVIKTEIVAKETEIYDNVPFGPLKHAFVFYENSTEDFPHGPSADPLGSIPYPYAWDTDAVEEDI